MMHHDPTAGQTGFLAVLSGVLAYVGSHLYGMIDGTPFWGQAVPIFAAVIAGAGPIVVQKMKERYDGRLRLAIAEIESLRVQMELNAEAEKRREALRLTGTGTEPPAPAAGA